MTHPVQFDERDSNANLTAFFEALPPEKIVSELCMRIYSPPFSKLRDRLNDLPNAIRVPWLIIDFDTEVMMQGMLGFLENSTGLYLNETIDAFRQIGAEQTVQVLSRVLSIMHEHSVTCADLRADFAGVTLHQISSFEELHGPSRTAMADAVCKAALGLYVHHQDGEPVWDMLDSFLAKYKTEFVTAIDCIIRSQFIPNFEPAAKQGAISDETRFNNC